MKSRKIILFIVEGFTDKNSLGLILSKILKNNRVEFHLVNGDITTKNDTTIQNCTIKVNDEVKKFLDNNRFKRNNLLRVVHLVDMDGAYIAEDRIINKESSKYIYTLENIYVQDKEMTINRNRKKSAILNKLSKNDSIAGTEYRMYYFSCNLEHILHDEQNLDDKLKADYSDKFVESYYGHEQDFIDFISDNSFSVTNNYNDSWEFIKQDNNSLKRYCNFNVYFSDYFDER